MSRLGFFLILLPLGLAFLPRCVSRTDTEKRFAESESLPAPALTTAVADPNRYSFAVVGDLHIAGGDTARLTRILTAATAEGDAFAIFLGDIVDRGVRTDQEAFRAAITAAGWDGRVFTVAGNHDVFYDGWESYRALNGPSHYVFDAGNARFVVLDTADGTVGETQRAWLTGELGKARPAHVFLLSHYLPVVPGLRTYLKLADVREAEDLMKLAVSHRVSGWLGAHYHSYVLGSADGVQYLVAGGGGGRRMDPVKEFFYARVSIDGSTVSYEKKTVD
jgi:hypothetical protein